MSVLTAFSAKMFVFSIGEGWDLPMQISVFSRIASIENVLHFRKLFKVLTNSPPFNMSKTAKGRTLEPLLLWTKEVCIMKNKTVIKPVRFSPEDIAEIERKAEQMQMSTSKYIRTMAIDGQAYKLEVPEYRDIMIELIRIGTNINQIARRLNEQGSFYYEEMAQIKEEYEYLCRMLNQFPSTLRLTEQ